MAESVKKRSEIEEQDTWKLEDMIESPEKFEELMDGVEERIQEYEAYREKLGNSAEYLKNYLTYDESVDETLSLLYAYAMQRRDQDTSVSENQALVSRVQSLAVKAMAASSFADPGTAAGEKGSQVIGEGGGDLSCRLRDLGNSIIGVCPVQQRGSEI